MEHSPSKEANSCSVIQEFHAFCSTQWFITGFARDCLWKLFRARRI